MNDFSEEFLAQQKARLLEMRAELMAQEESNKDALNTVELDQSKVGRLSRMDALQAQEMARATEKRRKVQLQRVDAALARLDAGEYGYCVVTGEPINRKRLELDPTAPTTVESSK